MNTSRAGILVIASGFVIHVLFFGFLLNYNVLYLEVQNTYNSTATETGLPGYVAYGIFNLITPLTTIFFKLTSHRTVVIVGVILCCAGLVLSALVTSVYLLIFSFGVLFGIGANFFHVPSLHLPLYYYSGKRYNQACVAVSIGIGTSILLSSYILENMFSRFGLRKTLLICGACEVCIGLILSITMVKPPPNENDAHKQDFILDPVESEKSVGNKNYVLPVEKLESLRNGIEPTEIEREPNPSISECDGVLHEPAPSNKDKSGEQNGLISTVNDGSIATVKARKKYRPFYTIVKMAATLNFWLCLPMFFLHYLAISFSFVNLGKFMEEKEMPEEVIVRTLSLMGVVDLVTRASYVLVAHWIPFSTCNVFGGMSCICFVISIIVPMNLSNDAVAVLLLGLSSPRAFLLMLTLPVCIEVFGKKKSAIAMSISYFFNGAGVLLSQPILGPVYDTTGSYDTTFHICAALYAVPAVAYWVIAFRLRRKKNDEHKHRRLSNDCL